MFGNALLSLSIPQTFQTRGNHGANGAVVAQLVEIRCKHGREYAAISNIFGSAKGFHLKHEFVTNELAHVS